MVYSIKGLFQVNEEANWEIIFLKGCLDYIKQTNNGIIGTLLETEAKLAGT